MMIMKLLSGVFDLVIFTLFLAHKVDCKVFLNGIGGYYYFSIFPNFLVCYGIQITQRGNYMITAKDVPTVDGHVSNSTADPVLTVYDTSFNVIAQNDNYIQGSYPFPLPGLLRRDSCVVVPLKSERPLFVWLGIH